MPIPASRCQPRTQGQVDRFGRLEVVHVLIEHDEMLVGAGNERCHLEPGNRANAAGGVRGPRDQNDGDQVNYRTRKYIEEHLSKQLMRFSTPPKSDGLANEGRQLFARGHVDLSVGRSLVKHFAEQLDGALGPHHDHPFGPLVRLVALLQFAAALR